jgi:hypothetical protein
MRSRRGFIFKSECPAKVILQLVHANLCDTSQVKPILIHLEQAGRSKGQPIPPESNYAPGIFVCHFWPVSVIIS